jgi:hypothetical protein
MRISQVAGGLTSNSMHLVMFCCHAARLKLMVQAACNLYLSGCLELLSNRIECG